MPDEEHLTPYPDPPASSPTGTSAEQENQLEAEATEEEDQV